MTTVEIDWAGTDAVRRRMRFEKRASGGWTRIEMRHNGSEWVATGQEIVSDVTVEADGDVSLDA